MSKTYYLFAYVPRLPYLALMATAVVDDKDLSEFLQVLYDKDMFICENLPPMYINAKKVGASMIYEFVDNSTKENSWLK